MMSGIVTASNNFDIAIIGAGIVGLSLAKQLHEKDPLLSIVVLEKELKAGLHSSGRNSGVIHAGIYYVPGSIKAKVCIEGAKRLKEWLLKKNLPYNQCGKIIIPTKKEQDRQIDLLEERGKANGAEVTILDEKQINKLTPYAYSATGRALWSPNTAVVNPLRVIEELCNELEEQGITMMFGEKNISHEKESNRIRLTNDHIISYGHIFNCAGLHADKLAHKFDVGKNYILLPFKGKYWEIKKTCSVQPKINIYPVPDLDVPFLGIHYTPSSNKNGTVTIGPTAIPAWGRENYERNKGIEPNLLIKNIALLGKQYLLNKGKIRRYTHEQAFINITPLLVNEARKLIPEITYNDIQSSNKVAIRPQLFNQTTNQLEEDFVCLNGKRSTHVLNAVSPAFTASFSLADLIINESKIYASET